MKKRLTDRLIKSLKAAKDRYEVVDSELPGFRIRIFPSGKKVFSIRYTSEGKHIRRNIGMFPLFNSYSARKKALQILRTATTEETTHTPQATQDTPPTVASITVAQLTTDYMSRGAGHKAESTLKLDEGRIRRHILPMLGKKPIRQLTRGDITDFVSAIESNKVKITGRSSTTTGGPIAARSSLALLSAMLTFAVNEGLLEANPAIGIKRAKTRSVERFLTLEELARLGGALAEDCYNEHARNIIHLLLLTGCRRNEIASLQWSYVDKTRHCIRLPHSKTGARLVPIGKPVLEFIDKLEPNDSLYIFPHTKDPDRFYSNTTAVWQEIRKNCDFADCRVHDLRHSFASIAAELGFSAEIIGALLGHSTGSITSRYIHFGNDTLGQAATKVAETVEARLRGGIDGAPKIPR